MATCSIYVGNSNLIELTGFKDAITGDPINDADVTFTVFTLAADQTPDDEVAGQSWPATMEAVEDSDGDYRGVLEDGAELEAGTTYVAVIEADGGQNRIGHFEFAFVAKTRRSE